MTRPLVCLEDVAQDLLALLGAKVHHLAALEAQPEVAHHRPVVDERQHRVDDAVGTRAVGRGEDLLGGDVGEERHTVLGAGRAALPDVRRRQADGEVRTVLGSVVKGDVACLVELALALGERRVVRLPGALGVVVDHAGRVQDRLPEAVGRLVVRVAREDLARPGHHRHATDAPGVLAKVDAVAIVLALPMRGEGARRRLGRVDAQHGIRVGAGEPQEGRAGAGERVHLFGLPGGELLETLERAVVVLEARDDVVGPDERDVARPRLVGALDEGARERRRLNRRGDDKLLTRPDGHPSTNEKLRVEPQTRRKLLHGQLALLHAHGYLHHLAVPSLGGCGVRASEPGRHACSPRQAAAHGRAPDARGSVRRT